MSQMKRFAETQKAVYEALDTAKANGSFDLGSELFGASAETITLYLMTDDADCEVFEYRLVYRNVVTYLELNPI